MEAWLTQLFSHLCGQNPGHTWSPGGEWLPFCQRCTGLYVGAALGGLLQFGLRLPPTSRWLQVYGLLLLQMVPFGFHWVPQNGWLRTVTGVLFGLGLVGFLRVGCAVRPAPQSKAPAHAVWVYGFVALAGIAGIPWLAASSYRWAGPALALAGFAGFSLLCGLVAGILFCSWRFAKHPRGR